MVQQDKFVFGITPAPSPLNPNPIIWRAYTTDFADEINIVDEKTNTLVGTIGGQSSYRYQKLPKTTISFLPYTQTVPAIGKVFELSLFPFLAAPFIFLNNGNIAYIVYSYNHFANGAIIYDCYDEETTDPNNGYWVAFRPSVADPTVLEKIAEIKQTDDYYNYGYDYTYQTPSNPNQCKFIRYISPNNDSSVLYSRVTTLTISGTSIGSTITVTEVENNFGGNTTLSLYNSLAPTPLTPGAANWFYRSPYYTGQDDYYGMMNGANEGWVWYRDSNDPNFGITAIIGYNILTGATTFVNGLAALVATTNLNPVAPVTISNMNTSYWEAHPTGLLLLANDGRVEDNGNNTYGVSALYSPQWVNSTKVVFLDGRDCSNGIFLNTSLNINNNTSAYYSSYGFDGLNFVQYGLYDFTANGAVLYMFRNALDVATQQNAEIAATPMSTPGYDFYFNYWEWNDMFMNQTYSAEEEFNQNNGPGVNIWSQSAYFVWPTASTKISQLQSNNESYPMAKIDNSFYSTYSLFVRDSILFGFQYDTYKLG